MTLQYVVAFQILCGCFAAFVAARRGLSWLPWFAVGLVVPVVGVVLALWAAGRALGPTDPDSVRPTAGRARRPAGPSLVRPKRPRRCTGSYVEDCQGCPYFRRNPLFEKAPHEDRKGYCGFFGRPLTEEAGSESAPVTVSGE